MSDETTSRFTVDWFNVHIAIQSDDPWFRDFIALNGQRAINLGVCCHACMTKESGDKLVRRLRNSGFSCTS